MVYYFKFVGLNVENSDSNPQVNNSFMNKNNCYYNVSVVSLEKNNVLPSYGVI